MNGKYEIINEVMTFNGKPCKLEFGNKEQISVLREYERTLNELNTNGLDVDAEYEIKFRFKCICGRQLRHDEDISSNDDVEDYNPERTCTCFNCNREYKFVSPGTSSNYAVVFIGFKEKEY